MHRHAPAPVPPAQDPTLCALDVAYSLHRCARLPHSVSVRQRCPIPRNNPSLRGRLHRRPRLSGYGSDSSHVPAPARCVRFVAAPRRPMLLLPRRPPRLPPVQSRRRWWSPWCGVPSCCWRLETARAVPPPSPRSRLPLRRRGRPLGERSPRPPTVHHCPRVPRSRVRYVRSLQTYAWCSRSSYALAAPPVCLPDRRGVGPPCDSCRAAFSTRVAFGGELSLPAAAAVAPPVLRGRNVRSRLAATVGCPDTLPVQRPRRTGASCSSSDSASSPACAATSARRAARPRRASCDGDACPASSGRTPSSRSSRAFPRCFGPRPPRPSSPRPHRVAPSRLRVVLVARAAPPDPVIPAPLRRRDRLHRVRCHRSRWRSVRSPPRPPPRRRALLRSPVVPRVRAAQPGMATPVPRR